MLFTPDTTLFTDVIHVFIVCTPFQNLQRCNVVRETHCGNCSFVHCHQGNGFFILETVFSRASLVILGVWGDSP